MMSDMAFPPIVFELISNEKLIWSGRPKQGIVFRPSDLCTIPVSFLWAGFAVVWESIAISRDAPLLLILGGIPFVVVSMYIAIGRFFVDAYIRSKTYYGLTNEHAIIIDGLLNRQIKIINVQTTSEISLDQRGDGSGSITFGNNNSCGKWYRGFPWPGVNEYMPPQFELITGAKQVYESIRQVQHDNQAL